MKSDLNALQISGQAIETLTGLDVNDIFVGGILGGVYRPSLFHDRRCLLLFLFTQAIATVLVFVFTLPIGLALTQNSVHGINQWAGTQQFLQITLSITFCVMVGWNVYMRQAGRRLKTLMHLLDEVDRYNEVLQAVTVLDQLAAIESTTLTSLNREAVLQALSVARDSLVAGLGTEKILRTHRNLLARRTELIANLEQNLITLRTLEVRDQANEYGQLLREALQIGLSVHQEMQASSHSSNESR